MQGNGRASETIRFGVFEVDPRTGELRKAGSRIRVQDQPFKVLIALLERPGEVVTREELQQRIWPTESFGDFDHAVNVAIAKLRTALADSAENPRYIETLPRRGYRFVFPVTLTAQAEAARAVAATIETTAPEPAHATSSHTSFFAVKAHRWQVGAVVISALIILGAVVLGIHSILHHPTARPFQNFTITQITDSGKAEEAAISPDGRFVLSAVNDSGLQSLWLRNLPTGSDTQIVPPSATEYRSLAFSPDGNQIYFRRMLAQGAFSLYRIPVLGGPPQKIVEDIDTNITFSPDGRQIAYARGNDPEIGEIQLLTTTLDGSDAKVLQSESITKVEPTFVAWAPIGNQIAYNSDVSGTGGRIEVFNLENSKTDSLAVFDDKFINSLSWSPDGRGIFVGYSKNGRDQIGLLWGPRMEFQPITRDTNSYHSLSLSADGRSLAIVQTKETKSFYILPGAGSQSSEPPPLSQANHCDQFNWAADGNLLTNGAGLWKMRPDGGNESQLLADAFAYPVACGNDYIVFAGTFQGSTQIGRARADGSGVMALTHGGGTGPPVCSPDHKWVYYDCGDEIYRIPLDGTGEAEAVTTNAMIPSGSFIYVSPLTISPDGETLAYWVRDTNNVTAPTLALLNLRLLAPPRLHRVNRYALLGQEQFTPDGKDIAYVVRENAVDNIWIQSLDGPAGHRITNFRSERIEEFHWSPDGKKLGVLRSKSESDVVVLQEAKP